MPIKLREFAGYNYGWVIVHGDRSWWCSQEPIRERGFQTYMVANGICERIPSEASHGVFDRPRPMPICGVNRFYVIQLIGE